MRASQPRRAPRPLRLSKAVLGSKICSVFFGATKAQSSSALAGGAARSSFFFAFIFRFVQNAFVVERLRVAQGLDALRFHDVMGL